MFQIGFATNWRNHGGLRSCLPHPDSPSGRIFDWSSLDVPHPDSPTGRTFDWITAGLPNPGSPSGRLSDWQLELSRIDHRDRKTPAQQVEDLKRIIDIRSDQVRERLPVYSVRALYDRVESSYGSSGPIYLAAANHITILLRKLQNAVRWFDPQLSRSPQSLECVTLLRQSLISWEFGTAQAQRDFLNQIEVLAADVYDTVIECIEREWDEAVRNARHSEVTEQWTARMLGCLVGASPGPAGQPIGEASDPRLKFQRSPWSRDNRRPSEQAGRGETKTWVEFQLIDVDGYPVPKAVYRVELPDGTTKNGRLNERGMVRLEGIDPGQCKVTFPEFDGREWQAV